MQTLQGRGPGRPQKYDWNLWTNGDQHTAVRGEDFDCQIDSFIDLMRKAGRLVNKRPVYEFDSDKVEFQFVRCRKSS